MMRSFGIRVALAAAALVWACGPEGHTSDCPPLPLYNVGQPLSARDKLALKQSADKGCTTLPAGVDGNGGSGGSD